MVYYDVGAGGPPNIEKGVTQNVRPRVRRNPCQPPSLTNLKQVFREVGFVRTGAHFMALHTGVPGGGEGI